ncbi:MAG: hypothetical protein A4E35_02232 [Methanoregula sp. PtaU1.Bin051]|nr:MAG: hypothetical protein A4E35_02232 [Methanoregula sp. PtaU1.Bin051]
MPVETDPKRRFLTDRMLGTLCRYLRFMGYDTTSANGLAPGDSREDTHLLDMARREHRILLTRDTELAGRGGELAVHMRSEDVMDQVQQLANLGLIKKRLMMSRCSLCNTELRNATEEEIAGADYAPEERADFSFYWCGRCRKLYWNGTHGKHLEERIKALDQSGSNLADNG